MAEPELGLIRLGIFIFITGRINLAKTRLSSIEQASFVAECQDLPFPIFHLSSPIFGNSLAFRAFYALVG